MTRINVIPAEYLSNKHLVAAWNEYPRIFTMIEKRIAKNPSSPLWDVTLPKEYVLGKGHCTFFFNKLHYIMSRLDEIYDEMKERSYYPSTVQYMTVSNRYATIHRSYPELCNMYIPSALDKLNNLSRLIAREPHNKTYKRLYQHVVNTNYPEFKCEKVTEVYN